MAGSKSSGGKASAHGDGVEGIGETLVPAINKLQDIFSQVTLDFKLDLPQVAVVGSQSSGKSSVLEGLVGRDFLPRGSNIVTRRPLILQLVKSPAAHGAGGKAEWGEFLHLPGKRFYDFARIRDEIHTETERLVGANKGVSDKPIRLKISSPHVLTMTLVDLPGFAKLPVGDQPSDIEARIRRMVLNYIASPNCIILAVSPANQDIVNSDALEVAKSVDPHGTRTIGVLTKLDIMDRGTDAAAVLRNETMPLRLGYIGVVNRSQEAINQATSMEAARAAEKEFFDSHPEYAEVAALCGMANLAAGLNSILVEHIRSMLPALRTAIEGELDKRARELAVLGEAPPGDSTAARGALLLQLLDSYSRRFTEMLEGRSDAMPVSELAGGARIRHIFQDIFVKGLDALNPSQALSDDDIRTAIKNSGGVRGSLLLPDAPFELLVRRAIARLLPPALQCKEFVHGELLRIAAHSVPPDAGRFPALQRALADAVEAFIAGGAVPADRMIRDLVACEHSFINTDHPQFIGGNRAIAQVLERRGAADGLPGVDSDGDVVEAAATSLPHHSKSTGALPGGGSRSGSDSAEPSGRLLPSNNGTRSGPVGLAGVAVVRGDPQPELLSPGELLGVGGTGSSPSPGSAASGSGDVAGAAERNAASGWFSTLFGRGKDAPHSPEAPLRQPPQTLKVQDGGSDQEQVQVQVTRLLVESYFDIVRKTLQDAVPKAVMHFLVSHTQRGLQQRLIQDIYSREEAFSELMAEREDVAAKRKACVATLRALQGAVTTLEGLPADLLGRVGAGGSRMAAAASPSKPPKSVMLELMQGPLSAAMANHTISPNGMSTDGRGSGGNGYPIGFGGSPW